MKKLGIKPDDIVKRGDNAMKDMKKINELILNEERMIMRDPKRIPPIIHKLERYLVRKSRP